MSFREKLQNNKFVITAEVAPPRGTNWEKIIKEIEPLKNKVDAFNVTDCQRSMLRMSALAMSKLLLDKGFEPILQITCRDKNRIAIQSELLGAYAFGIKNVCLMTGDFTTLGDTKDAKPVFDLDSVQLIKTTKDLSEGKLINGKEIKEKLSFTIGAVFNPFAGPEKLQIMKLKKKIEAGAVFIQTQPIYDLKTAEETASLIRELKSKAILGLLPLKSIRMADFIEKLNPGSIPKKLKEKLEKSAKPAEYGWEYTIELAKAFSEFSDGVHFMLVGKTEELSEFIVYLKNNHGRKNNER